MAIQLRAGDLLAAKQRDGSSEVAEAEMLMRCMLGVNGERRVLAGGIEQFGQRCILPEPGQEDKMTTCMEHLKKYLHDHGVVFEVQHHREVFTAQAVAAELHEKGAHVAKVVIGRADGRIVMLVVPAPARVDFERAARAMGAQFVRPAREDEFKSLFPDCEVGATPPFGNLYGVAVYLDQSLTLMPAFVFQAGSHRDTLRIALADYLRLATPKVGVFIQEPY
jgi:Ala-tRNA(Pro) deacylase